jgi:hypothetical protein
MNKIFNRISALSVLALIVAAIALPSSNAFARTYTQAAIKEVQVVQVLGKQFEDRKDYVAGKDALVRVIMSAPMQADPSSQKVEIARDGTAVVTLDAAADAADPSALLFTCPDRGACGDWAAGTYSFDAKIGSETQKVDGIKFLERKALRILAVPVKANYGGNVQGTTGRWKQAGDFMKQTYPVAPANYNWQNGNELDASGYDINTDEGRAQLWQDLSNLQPQECANAPSEPNCFDLIVGFIPTNPQTAGGGSLQGYTMGKPANIVVESDEDMPATVAHEVGHVYGLGDEYEGGQFNCEVNPVPPSFTGKNFNNAEQSPYSCASSKEQPFPGASGTLIPAIFMPFEIGGRGLLPDMVTFMGTGSQQAQAWITPRAFAHLFTQLDPSRTASLPTTPKIAKLAAPQRYLYASGFIPNPKAAGGKVELDPWYAFDDDAPLKATKGDYIMEALDASGKVLASNGFKILFAVPDQPKDLDKAPFEVVLPFPQGTAKFVVKKGTTVLGERIVSKNVPTVSVLTPKANENVDGSYSITWEGKDADNDKLFYDVEYSPDGSDDGYFFLAGGLSAAKHVENFKDLPGGDKATIRITVSDGILTSEAVSAAFKVPAKPPEIFLDAPKANATFKAGQEVALEGYAYDMQIDDWLFEDELVWTSDKDGEIGKGELLFVDKLSKGNHTITLTATSPSGLKATQTVKITIGDAASAAQPSTPASGGGGLCGSPALALLPLGMVVWLGLKKRK